MCTQQGDQRQEKSGNFKIRFQINQKSENLDFSLGENQGNYCDSSKNLKFMKIGLTYRYILVNSIQINDITRGTKPLTYMLTFEDVQCLMRMNIRK